MKVRSVVTTVSVDVIKGVRIVATIEDGFVAEGELVTTLKEVDHLVNRDELVEALRELAKELAQCE